MWVRLGWAALVLNVCALICSEIEFVNNGDYLARMVSLLSTYYIGMHLGVWAERRYGCNGDRS